MVNSLNNVVILCVLHVLFEPALTVFLVTDLVAFIALLAVLSTLQFGTHDVVVLKPNKADLGSPPLGQGVVYRLKVILALDKICRLPLSISLFVILVFMLNRTRQSLLLLMMSQKRV